MPARGYSVTPRTERNGAPSKRPPARSVGSAVAAAGRREKQREAAQAQRLRRQVDSQRANVRKGRGVRADTGDVARGSRVALGEKRRSAGAQSREDLRAALEGLAQSPRLHAVRGAGLSAALDRELSGRGDVAKAFSAAANFVGEHALLVQTGPTVAGGVAKPKKKGGGLLATATAPNPRKLKDVRELRNAVEDLINFPAVAVPSLYVPAASLVEAARGDSRRGKQFLKDVQETDPIYNLVTGKPGKALELAREHPGFTAIEVAGLKGAAGRTAGRVVRGTGRATGSARLKSIGSTKRESAVIPGTALEVRREYSRDLGRKALQVRRDRTNIQKATRLRQQARQAESTDPDRAIDLRKRANRVDPRIASDRDLKARVNLTESRNENLRRQAVSDVDARASAIIKEAGDTGAAPVLVTSGITRASVADLVSYARELHAAHGQLTDPGKRAANVRLRQAIGKSVRAAQRRGDPDLRGVLSAAQRYSKEIDQPLDRTLADMGLLAAERGARAKLIPFAARDFGAKVDPDAGVTLGGRPASTAELQTAARAAREVDPSYVSQAPAARGSGAYYRSSAREPTVGARARTEKPTVEGTFDAAPEMLRARAMNAQGLASAAKNFRDSIAESGLRNKGGTVRTDLTRQKAEGLKRALEAKHGLEFELVAVRPWAARRDQLQALQDAVDAGGQLDPRAFAQFRDGLVEAFEGKGDGPFALVPRAVARQQVQHLKVLGPTDVGRAVRGVRSAFTRTVLTTSPGPTFGNIVEPIGRAAVMRAGPVSALRGRGAVRELKRLDPEAALKLEATIGRGKVTLAAQQRYVDPMQFDQGFVRQSVAGWQALKRARGVKRLVAAWDMWTHFVFDSVNGRTEAFFRQGPLLGKVLRDSGLMDHTVLGLSKRAMREAAKGLTDTPTQALLAKKLNDAYGKYQGFSPGGRKVIAEYTPFAAWWLSSMTFIGKVLPRDHPALLAMIASAEQATEEWRLAQGLDLFAGRGKLPGWLQGTVPAGKAGSAKIAYNTPFGAATDPGEALSSLVFPQGENFLKAMQGFDWKNKKLRNKDGTEYDEIQKTLYAIGEVAKSTVPAVAVPLKAERYVSKPSTLLNPVRVPPRSAAASAGSTAPAPAVSAREAAALQREAQALYQEQASRAEQDALQREARLLYQQKP